MELNRTQGSRPYRALALVLTLLILPVCLLAQETRGRLTGRVLDPSNAAVAGASVTIRDVARGTTVSASTDSEGLFQANYLLPGSYEVTVEFAGFKKYVRDKVQLQMTETRDLPIKLEVGGQEETITVSTEAVALNTSDANMGFTVDTRRIADLPLIHGDPYKIMGLATGLAHSGSQRLDRPYEPTHIVGFAYDGTRSNRSDLLIDGVPSTSTANANEVIASYVPPSDLVQEFKVQTATFDAQFGNTEGGVTSMSIKSGTNNLHGSLYYFAEPVSLAANDVFGRARGQDRIDSSSTRPGITVTGPVVIPGLYNGRDKTFFTLGFERIRDERPRFDAGSSVWVPTEALRNGDFSAFSSNILIYDPLTRVPSGTAGQYVGQPFPGNRIPEDRISPVARAILGYYRLPLSDGLTGNIFDSTLPEVADYNNFTFRVDQRVAENNRMFVRGSWYKRDSHYNDYMGNGVTSTNFQFISYQGVIDDVHVFNPSTVLNLRYGYNRFERNSGQEAEYVSDFDLTSLGFPAQYNSLVPADQRRFPRIEFPGNTMVGTAFGNDFRPTTIHTVASTLNKTMASHSFKLGMEMRIYREDSLPTGNATSGRYVFNNNYTRQNSASGTDYEGLQAYASFLLGLPSTLEISRLGDYSEYSKTWGFFIHDDWRVSSKLTLNIGLRYELETALTERNDKSVSGFDLDYVQPFEATAQARYAALNDPVRGLVPQINARGGLTFAGVDGSSRLYEVPTNTLLPRLGFAYQLNSKTVFRGGVGLFAGFLGQRRGDVILNGYSQTTTLSTTTLPSGAPVPQNWQNAFVNNPILDPVGNANGRQQGVGTSVTFFNQNPAVSKQLRWQVGVQRELPWGFLLEAAYVGNYGYDIEITQDINALPNQYLNGDNSRTAAMNTNNSFLTAQVPNPFQGLLPGSSMNGSTVARSQLLRPYPAFQNITTTNNDGKSWYQSAQASLQKRMSHGFTLGASYTYSRWEQATEYLNAGDPEPTRMISDLDVPHRLSLSAIIELPFGKGRRFGSNAGGVLNGIIGGWQIQGVYTYQTGFPIPFGNFNTGTGQTAGDLFYNGGEIAIDDPTSGRWFNTGAFTNIVDGATANDSTPVNHLRTTPYRFDDARRDPIDNVDLSLIKDIQFKGDVRLQLRAEFINVLNEPYFPNPVVGAASSTFGQVSASNQENYARRAQIGVKLLF